MRGLAHPFRDTRGNLTAPVDGDVGSTLLAAARQAEFQNRTIIRWYLSRRMARRLSREQGFSPVREHIPVLLFGIPAEIVDAPDGFGMVVR